MSSVRWTQGQAPANAIDYKAGLGPLPDPPADLAWVRLDGGAWELATAGPTPPAAVAVPAEEGVDKDGFVIIEAKDVAAGAADEEEHVVEDGGVVVLGDLAEPAPRGEDDGDDGDGDHGGNNFGDDRNFRDGNNFGDGESLFHRHVVMPGDTLAGLMIRYGIHLRELKRHNDFPGRSFQSCATLRIPKRSAADGDVLQLQDPDRRDVKLRRFRVEASASDAEATYYLGLHDWDLDAAVASFRDDAAWEALTRGAAALGAGGRHAARRLR